MNSATVFEQLDQAIETMRANREAEPQVSAGVAELLEVAAQLESLPRPEFKARLKSELLGHAAPPEVSDVRLHRDNGHSHREIEFPPVEAPGAVLPTLFGAGQSSYPVRRTNFFASVALHAAAAALLAVSSTWVADHHLAVQERVVTLIDTSPYILPPAPDEAGGGGGGGAADKLAASHGSAPKFGQEQLTPPAVVLPPQPKLAAEPTVIGPPELRLPQTGQLGDPLSAVLAPPSSGVGVGGGIGSGSGGGVGSGRGPGVGPGMGGGFGGGVYKVGGGVSAPQVLFAPDPEYSDEARKAKYQGTVILWAIIGADGRPQQIKVARSLGMGLDEKAIAAVRHWRFEPAKKDGQAVAVQVNIEVNFRMY